MSAYRSTQEPTFEPLCTFSKARLEDIEAQRKRLRSIAIVQLILIVTSLGGTVFTLATGGGMPYVLLLPLAACAFLLLFLRGKLQALRELGVRVSYCAQTKTVRFEGHPSTRVEIAVSDLVALRAVEEALAPITVRGTYPRARFALIAETRGGPIVIAQALLCTGVRSIAMGREYLGPALDAVLGTIQAAAK